MLHAKVHNLITGEHYEFDAVDQSEIDARLERKPATYGRAAWTDPDTGEEHPATREVDIVEISAQAAAQAAAIAAVQARLDGLAQAWGYDDIKSGAGYRDDPYPRFNAEGWAMFRFRSATWAAVDQHRDAASWEELLSFLPELPARPVVES